MRELHARNLNSLANTAVETLSPFLFEPFFDATGAGAAFARVDLVVALGALPLVIVFEGDLVDGAEAWVAVVRRGRVEMGAAGEDLRGGIREETRGCASPGGTFVKCARLFDMRAHH